MFINDWKMTYENYKDLECTCPCTMYGVLLDKGLINDPFYGLNDILLTDYSRKNCSFTSHFFVDEEILKNQFCELTFYGLDTLCRIYVNGILVDSVKNMHRTYTYDVKDILFAGENTIMLEFDSPIEYFEKMNNNHYLYTVKEAVQGAAHLRKALYMSGWDWGPQLPDMGIYRPVELCAYNCDKIDNIFVLQNHNNGKVVLDIEVETKHNNDVDIFVEIDGRVVKCVDKRATVIIDNPKLWWIRGYGEQYLYDIKAEMKVNDKVVDTKTQKIGLRTLTVSTAPDKWGREFCFVINGVKIFAMGANYIPQDNLLSRISPERTRALLETAKDANFNCLRVWGGGYYPEDEFYDMCDEMGFVVWQDFMIACANVWLTRENKEEFVLEAVDNVRRIRHHASLGMFCGNNEMELAVLKWGGGTVGQSMLVKEDYIELYERIFPEICRDLCPQTFYWQSSPSSGGGFVDPNNENMGDVHYWSVWHSSLPFSDYRNHKFRFCSEYGFESYPSFKTVKSFCPENELNCFSRVMEDHQKCRDGNKKILMYLADRYLYPNNLESLCYASQLLQADAIKYGVEHFRRNRGICMGSTYWQFNDCWPVASWSSIDSNMRYKALHYAAKKFYAPVALGLFLEDGVLTVNVANETMSDFDGEIRICHVNSKFEILRSLNENVSVKSLKSKDAAVVEFEFKDKFSEYVYVDLYDKDGNFIMRQSELFVVPKHFSFEKPRFRVEFTDVENGVMIEVSSDVFAKGVCIDFEDYDVVLSDNYFDLTNKDTYTVVAKTDIPANELEKSLKIMSVYDIGR